MWTVYRLYDKKGVCLYVGLTEDWPRRLRSHANATPWIRESVTVGLETFSGEEDGRAQELLLIQALRPIYNINTTVRVKMHARSTVKINPEIHARLKAHCIENYLSMDTAARSSIASYFSFSLAPKSSPTEVLLTSIDWPHVRAGVLSANSKLTDVTVREIRKLNMEGWGARRLAGRFEVSRATIRSVLQGQTWSHVK